MQHLGKKSTTSFAIYLLLFTDKISSFVEKKASENFMQEKGERVVNKTIKSKFCPMRMRGKQNSCLITSN